MIDYDKYFENFIMCYMTGCLYRDTIYCTHDEHMIIPNTKKCPFFVQIIDKKNSCEASEYCKGVGCAFE